MPDRTPSSTVGRWLRQTRRVPDRDAPVLVVQVRDGEAAAGSWLYAWVRVPSGDVVHIGGTGLHPQVRTWLHLTDPRPEVGRLRARHPELSTDAFDVLAFELPAHVDRPRAKRALITAAAREGLLGDAYIGDAPSDGGTDGELEPVVLPFLERIRGHRPG